jgi:hypothetical protein
MLIFGSVALKHWLPDLKREPNDIDYICKDKPKNSEGIEYHWVDGFEYILKNNKDPKYVDLDFLYTIKVSHASWDVRWDKTMFDITFMRKSGAKLDYELYKLLYKDWEVVHHKKRIKVEGNADAFFNSNIKRVIPHDDLHEIVKFYDKPLHMSIRRDLTNVKVDKELWNNLGDKQIKCALEEIYVFAFERYFEKSPKQSIHKTLKQLITQSSKGFFNIFLIENFTELYYYDLGHFNKCIEKVKEYDKKRSN